MIIEDQHSDNISKSYQNNQKSYPMSNDFQINEYDKNNQYQSQLKVVEERIETQDSAISDCNLSPRQKMHNKLTKKIRIAFNKT
mmetsp:Transcript_32003/g.31304  ORF Transcript_32003/g.31304 Transcript_32003/m.31304 type:complete len:84 (+) Transcript_32003:554-805(+)